MQIGYDYWHLPRNMTNCSWFVECPFCYRCRSYNPKYIKCSNCNISKCNTNKHTPDVLAKMIMRPKLEVSLD